MHELLHELQCCSTWHFDIPHTWIGCLLSFTLMKIENLKVKVLIHSLLNLKCIIKNPHRHLVNRGKGSQEATCWTQSTCSSQKEIPVVSFVFSVLLSSTQLCKLKFCCLLTFVYQQAAIPLCLVPVPWPYMHSSLSRL